MMSTTILGQVWGPGDWGLASLALTAIVGVVSLFVAGLAAKYFNLWIQAKMTHADVGMLALIGMTLRKVDPGMIVRSKIMAIQSGMSVRDGLTTRGLEAHYLAGGNVPDLVRALIAADRADIPLSFKRAAAIDLAGRNVLGAVRMSVNPRVIDCPDPSKGRQTIDAVAQDGIQLKVKARVTVRIDLDRLVGGATEETIIARVGEGIVTAIGSAATFKLVLEQPDSISKRVLGKGLDSGTAYEILSIDIAAIDVGDNIGAKLQASQAEADIRVARAMAEGRRAFAVAREQEMLAAVQRERARLVLAEAEVAPAIAATFREGHIRRVGDDRLRRSALARRADPPAVRRPVGAGTSTDRGESGHQTHSA
jgi:uncharacterized protein YqfA (UPF0365 family)